MEQFETEEQQVEAIKKFFKENGLSIIVGAALGLGGLFGWRAYTDNVIEQKETASSSYQTAMQALVSGDEGSADQAQAFVDSDPKNGYALLASLQLAKQAVDAENLDEAVQHLTLVAINAESEALKNIANLRLARIQAEQEKHDVALSSLDKVTGEAFAAQVEETKGDVFVKQKMFDKARAAYSAALEDNENNPVLKMKLDNLAAAANG